MRQYILEELSAQENRRLLLSIQRRRILELFDHIIRRDGLEKIIIQKKKSVLFDLFVKSYI